ncbi:hypothetical protein [Lysinibacillus fusiformis]
MSSQRSFGENSSCYRLSFKKLSMQAMLTFAAMDLKKLATWTWQVA